MRERDTIEAGSIYNWWYIGIPPEKGRALAEQGEAVCIGGCNHILGLPGNDPVYVRQHVVRSLEETFKTIDRYQKLADRYGISVFFRGQNRDYLNGICLNVSPVDYRQKLWSSAYSLVGKIIVDEQFGPWAE